MKSKYSSNYNGEKGSVFFYILLGIVLFGTLAFTVSRGMRGNQADTMSDKQAEIVASEILNYAQKLEHSVNKMLRKNVSESDICFSNAQISATNLAAYDLNSGCSNNKNKLYHPQGGGLSFTPVQDSWLESSHSGDQGYGEWMFSSSNSVLNLGGSVELIAHINHLKKSVCEKLNEKLSISGIPDNVAAFAPTSPSQGSFNAVGQVNNIAFSGKYAGCFKNSATWSSYIFYYVLIER